jgi:5,10-methylenetetrahydromethanopterin reductase
VGIAVTNVVTRHVSVVANAIRSLAEQFPGRFRAGLGAGSSSTGTVGLRASRQAELREAVVTLRELLAGSSVDLGWQQAEFAGGSPVECPLFLAATGDGNLALAGEVADGVIMLNGSDPASLDHGLARTRLGEARRDRGLPPLRRLVTAFCMPTTDPARDARRLKPLCVVMAQQLGAREALERHGIHVSAEPPAVEVRPDLLHPLDWDLAIDAVDHLVTDEDALAFGRQFCLFGTMEEISDQVAAMARRGVDEVMLQELESFRLPLDWVTQCSGLLPFRA